MTALLAFISFVIAAFIFILSAAFGGGIAPLWGHFFVAVGLAFMCLGGAYGWSRSRQSS